MPGCENGCGRKCAPVGRDGRVFKSCCRSCAHLKKEGKSGHDIECDIRANDAVCPPWYWSAAAKWPEPFHEEVGGEYVKQMGNKILQRGLPDHEVVRCRRVEDAVLYEKYAAKRAQIRERAVVIEDIQPQTSESISFSAKTTLDQSVNEVWLLHGTSEEAAKAIAKSNFNGSSGGTFGPGTYFADDAKKSNQYARGATEDGCKIMLLCRVTLGGVKKLEPGQNRTAEFFDDPNIDSVLGVSDAREFVVYDSAQIYPEYIMYYKQSDSC